MDTFGILSPDGHPLFVADLPNERGSGNPHHQYVRSEQELQHLKEFERLMVELARVNRDIRARVKS